MDGKVFIVGEDVELRYRCAAKVSGTFVPNALKNAATRMFETF